MTACLAVGAITLALAAPQFTLRWTHSVEKVEWVELWQIHPAGLHLSEARIKGSGAGMEPAADARLQDGWWVWYPDVVVPHVSLAASGATGAGWQLCDTDRCHQIGDTAQAPLLIEPCHAP